MPLCRFDLEIKKKENAVRLIGIDEAGRGPIAGPVTACAAFIPPEALRLLGKIVNDSKKLSPVKREKAFLIMLRHGVKFGFGWASAEEIDRTDILSATFKAMRSACARLFCQLHNETGTSRKYSAEDNGIDKNILPPFEPAETLVLVDGNHKIRNAGEIWQQEIIDGDAKSASVAAASIFAKVIRDRWMTLLSKKYPEYSFEKHKGYGTAAHIRAVELNGPCPEHRLTFAPLKQKYFSAKRQSEENKEEKTKKKAEPASEKKKERQAQKRKKQEDMPVQPLLF